MECNYETSVVIIGGGVAGIAAANHFRKNNIDYLLLEKESDLGGLLRPLNYDGYKFDRAVHLSFATEKEVRAVFDKTDFITHQPDSYNWDQDVWIRHPVQNNLYPLDLTKKIKALTRLLKASATNSDIDNYQDWLYCSYGQYFADNYPGKYTKKYWRFNPDNLDIDWLGPRMEKPNIELVLEGAISQTEKNTYYVKEMRYPKAGNYYEFIRSMASNVRAFCNEEVISVDLDGK